MADLKTTYMGLELRSPIIAGSCGLTSNVEKMVEMEKAGAGVLVGLHLPNVRFHDIRHTFAMRAIEQGVDAATVAGLLGHADVTTTTHYYVHPREASMHREMEAIEPVGKIGHAWQNTRLFAPAHAEEKIPKAAQRIHRRRKHIAGCV